MNKKRILTEREINNKEPIKNSGAEELNDWNEKKNAIESIKSRMNQAEERIYNIEHSNFEIIQSEENKEERMEKSEESLFLWWSIEYHQRNQFVNY